MLNSNSTIMRTKINSIEEEVVGIAKYNGNCEHEFQVEQKSLIILIEN